jgi:hypothetical protein
VEMIEVVEILSILKDEEDELLRKLEVESWKENL